MKALTVKQPWAELIVSGAKDIENRTWKTNYRGRVLIHAAKSPVSREELLEYPLPALWRELNHYPKGGSEFCNGAIIGSVEIVDCIQDHISEWAEPDIWNWVLANPIRYEVPITDVKGKLSIWDHPLTNNKGFPYGLLEYILSPGYLVQEDEQYKPVFNELHDLHDKFEYLEMLKKVLFFAPCVSEKIKNSIQSFRNHEGNSIVTIKVTSLKRFVYEPKDISGLMDMLEKL